MICIYPSFLTIHRIIHAFPSPHLLPTIMHHLRSLPPLLLLFSIASYAAPPQTLIKGFSAEPDPSTTGFQPLLADPNNTFALSFLRVGNTQLALAVVHLASGDTLWQARFPRLPRWSSPTRLIFNGSLVVSDPHSGIFWSTDTDGDLVSLSHSSNLQISNSGVLTPLWQSFDFPSDTLVENQNFTASMALVSSNGAYTMRLGPDFIGLYARFNPGKDQIYYKHGALEAKADIVQGRGPIYIRISPDGYLGMYQTGLIPVDIQSFTSYMRPVPGIRRMQLGPDGDLKGYFWSGSAWVLDYQAISEPCDFPTACGPYGLCLPDQGSCSCLGDDRTHDVRPGEECSRAQSGDFCGATSARFGVLRRAGVEPPYKELMGYLKAASLEQCEKWCEANCSCWGTVYNNGSGFCYTFDYPIQTLVETGDVSKVGYFKVRVGTGGRSFVRRWIVLCGAVVVVAAVGGICCWSWMAWKRRKRSSGVLLDGEKTVVAGRYRGLESASFGSVELGRK